MLLRYWDMVSKVKWVKLKEFVSVFDKKNSDGKNLPVYGINKDNEFMPTVANMDGVDTSKYKILSRGVFAFNGMHVGRDIAIPIGKYNFDFDALISPAYTTFTINNNHDIIPDYFEVIIRVDEFDRLGWFYCDSSVRGGLDWKRFLDIQIPLPSIEEQQKVVNTWKAFREIKEQNEEIAAPLMQVCQSYIQDLKHKYENVEIGPYIEEYDSRNKDSYYKIDDVRGISIEKKIIDTKANMDGVSLDPYKIFKTRSFCYVTITSRNGDKITLSLNPDDRDYIVSSSYITFDVKNPDVIIPEFLYLWFCRPEFDRYARFNSWGSAREAFSFEDMKRIQIPLPPIDVQRAIVNIYNCANEAKRIAEEADRKSREVCPALLQHIIHS